MRKFKEVLIMNFEKMGILQVGDRRFAVKLLRADSRYGEPSEITLTVVPGVFDTSNGIVSMARQQGKTNMVNWFARFVSGADLATPRIERVIFNPPATIVIWSDDSKTVVKCQPNDVYDEEKGLAMCIAKKYFGNTGNFNEVFKTWIKAAPKFRIIETGYGCRGAMGRVGYRTTESATAGLLASDPGYNVKLVTGAVWRINLDAKIEYLK